MNNWTRCKNESGLTLVELLAGLLLFSLVCSMLYGVLYSGYSLKEKVTRQTTIRNQADVMVNTLLLSLRNMDEVIDVMPFFKQTSTEGRTSTTPVPISAIWTTQIEQQSAIPWRANTTYTAGQIVGSNGNLYQAQESGTSGTNPPAHTENTESDGSITWIYKGILTKRTYYLYMIQEINSGAQNVESGEAACEAPHAHPHYMLIREKYEMDLGTYLSFKDTYQFVNGGKDEMERIRLNEARFPLLADSNFTVDFDDDQDIADVIDITINMSEYKNNSSNCSESIESAPYKFQSRININ